jgi:hypothetical protein
MGIHILDPAETTSAQDVHMLPAYGIKRVRNETLRAALWYSKLNY